MKINKKADKKIDFFILQRKKAKCYSGTIVSELKMHKILYFLYGDFYFEYRKELFKCNFESWRLGPVEKNYRITLKNNENIFQKFNIAISENEYKFLCKTISYLLQFSTSALVDASHMTNPWKDNYSWEINKWKSISKEDIQRYFSNNFLIFHV